MSWKDETARARYERDDFHRREKEQRAIMRAAPVRSLARLNAMTLMFEFKRAKEDRAKYAKECAARAKQL